jgi:methionyl-tRNA formyltransferase
MGPRGSRPLTLLLAAEEAAGVHALKLLAGGPHRLVAVLAGRPPGHALTATVRATAERLGLPVWDPMLLTSAGFAERVQRERLDLLLNVHSLVVAAREVVAAPTIGSFNLHPGPLPEYAGLNVPSWAIYNGESRHAVTLHWMAADVDTGPVAFRADFPIQPHDTGFSLTATCVRQGTPLLARLVDLAAEDPAGIPRVPQDPARRHYYRRGAPHGGRMPWNEPAARLANLVRAADYGPFPSPWGRPAATAGGLEFGVLRATTTGRVCASPPGTVGAASGDAVHVAAAGEWLLVERISVDGRPRAPAQILREGDRLDGSSPGSW